MKGQTVWGQTFGFEKIAAFRHAPFLRVSRHPLRARRLKATDDVREQTLHQHTLCLMNYGDVLFTEMSFERAADRRPPTLL